MKNTCGNNARALGHNPVGVEGDFSGMFPQGSGVTPQPWALGRNLVEVGKHESRERIMGK